jgi:MYXO-CTERM domain-containing protein
MKQRRETIGWDRPPSSKITEARYRDDARAQEHRDLQAKMRTVIPLRSDEGERAYLRPARARGLSFVYAAGVVALSLVPRAADAFVRSVSSAGNHLYWSSSCEAVSIYLNGFTEMTPDEVAKSIAAAAAAWGPGEVTCPTGTSDAGSGNPSFEIIPQFATGSAPVPANDGNNTVVFQTTMAGWESLPGNPPCEALAFATPWKQPDGQIVDVDIEVNAVPGCMPGPLANLDPGVAPPMNAQYRFDLQTLMTHEFGHFLGLAHTCIGTGQQGSDDGDGPPAGSTDSYGQPIPTCTQYPDAAEAVQAAAVMWYEIDFEDSAKRVLTLDDARGVCAIYPPARVAPTCTQNRPDDGCGCDASGRAPRSRVATGLAALALLAARRRRLVGRATD